MLFRGTLSRRGFIQKSLAALGATGVPAWYAREVIAAEEQLLAQQKENVQANERHAIGVVGIGSPQSRGLGITNDALNTKRGVQVVAVCDADKNHLDRAVTLMKEKGQSAQGYKDFRELLDRKDLDAVLIATPEHWHTLVAIDAMRKRKDVYCEKPLTLFVSEGQALTKVAKETERIFQVGSQQRSDARFRMACELVRNGRIGKVERVETRIGTNPKGGPFKVEEPPDGLDWDLWQGPTPKVDYVKQRCHYEFRWWYDYSGGKVTDWGAHHNDIAQWGLGADGTGPVAVEGEGEAPSKEPNSYNCHPRFKITYTYASGAKLICSDGQLPGSPAEKEGNGVVFVGEAGKWIFVKRGGISASDPKLLEEPLAENATKLYLSPNHMANFIDGIKNRKPCICTAEVGHRSVSVCHIGNIAVRTGLKLKWDPAKEQFDNADANQMLTRAYRAPWRLGV